MTHAFRSLFLNDILPAISLLWASLALPFLPTASSLKNKIKFKLLKLDLSKVKRIFKNGFF